MGQILETSNAISLVKYLGRRYRALTLTATDKDNLAILNNSKFIKRILALYITWKEKAASYLRASVVSGWIGEVKKELYSLPVKTSSIILISMISTNMFFSALLSKEIGWSGWIIRLLFLFIGLAGLTCNASWEDIKKTSLVLRKN